MHWWIRPKVPVQSGMFCCGRSKGDEDPRKLDEPNWVPSATHTREDKVEGVTSISKLLEDSEQEADLDATPQEAETRLLGAEKSEGLDTPDHLQQSLDEAESRALGTSLSPRRRPPARRSLSDPASAGRTRERRRFLESSENFDESESETTSQDVPSSVSQHRRDLFYLRSASQDEGRSRESLTRLAERERLLKELALHTRLQSSEQRIQLQDLSHQPRLHLPQQQYQLPYQIQQQQQQLLQHKQPQEQHLYQQYFQRRSQQSLPESAQSPSGEKQSQHQIYHHYPNQYQQQQQLPLFQPQHQQQQQKQSSYLFQQQQQQQQQIYQQHQQQKPHHLFNHRRGHETPPPASLLPQRAQLQHYRVYDAARSKPVSSNYAVLTSATTASTLVTSSGSGSHVYANVRAPYNGIQGPAGLEMGIKSMEVEDESFVVETVEIIKRPGQTLGFYIREGNGYDRSDGVFISRIQMGTVAQTNGLLHVGDEIVTVNNVKVGNMSLDDVVILMSIPKKLVLTIRTRRNSSKNKSCPALPMAEKPDPPIVVLKKGRSSSASALEMTEKCPDMFEPGQAYAQYPFQTADYMPRRDLSQERQAQSTSRYASIFITPQRAEAKLVNDEGVDSSNSSEGSLPRSVDSSKDRAYLGQEVGEPSHTGYMSVTNPIYDHFSIIADRDYKHHHHVPDSMGRKTTLPKSPSKQSPLSSISHMYRGRSGVDTSPSYTEPPYMNVGVLREGLLQQQQQQQHYQHHLPSSHFPSAHHQQHLPLSSHQYYQSQSQPHSYGLQTSPLGTSYPLPSQQYRGGMPISQEERRRQERLRTLLNSKTRYGRLLRSRSPECYNSDSELIFTHQQPTDGRGFASDYETYGGAFSDDEPVYSIPRIPSSSSSELEMLLKKFSSLSQELQQEQSKLQRQLSGRDKSASQFYGPGQLPLSRADSLSGDDYVCQPLSGQGSPLPIRRAASTQTSVLPPRLTRHSSADTPSFMYSTYQHEDLTAGGAVGGAVAMSIAGGMPVSTSQTSMQLAKHGESSMASSRPVSGRLRDLHLTRKPLHIPYSEFEPYKADMRKRVELTRAGGLDGLLSIHIMSGQGLKSSKTSLRDLYCVVAVDSLNKARTMIRTGAINFDWDEAFDVDLEDAKEVSFLIYHWDPNYKHRLCFHGSILLPGYVHSGHKRYVAIKLEPKGILFVTLLYKEPALSLQRLPSIKKNALFGVELETIILRENSGLNVPLVVHKCVQEVERRGLDTVGIYRLCGSARRKAMLREAFENNAQDVDLSPENVSDVHVVTGVLKDYLRELPEPLFTNALYQMLLDALSVRLPCDPEGSAKLMLSILECLPSANQDTMALLLNHLRRVASHSEKNKMPIDNLAICFGPVLLCPAPSSTPNPALDFKKHIEVLRYLLEIWDYEGSTSTGTSKSPTADTVISAEAVDTSQQSARLLSHSSHDDVAKTTGEDAILGTSPRQ